MNKILLVLYLTLMVCAISCSKEEGVGGDSGKQSFLDVSLSTINYAAEKDASLVEVSTDGDWQAACDADWITLSAKEGEESTAFIIGVSSNLKFAREAVVTITAGKKSKEIRITQSGVSVIEFEINGVDFKFLPVEADTSFWLDGMTYLATRTVYLDSYFISETEITNEQWRAVMGSLPYENENSFPKLPVVVNWNNITNEFLTNLNTLNDYTFRLPTENEWEVAAKGGLKSENTGYPGSIYIDEVAWYWDNAYGQRHNVATKIPNELGLYDMAGNVSEWCSDWYQEWTDDNLPPSESTNPTGPESGTEKVIRGGDFRANQFEYDRNNCSPSARDFLPPDIATEDFLYDGYYHYTGFRLVIPKN